MPTIGYIGCNGSWNWVFTGHAKDTDGQAFKRSLRLMSQVSIVRHAKIKSDANPFDPLWDDYFDKRRMKRLRDIYAHKRNMKTLLRKSDGLCLLCKQPINLWFIQFVTFSGMFIIQLNQLERDNCWLHPLGRALRGLSCMR